MTPFEFHAPHPVPPDERAVVVPTKLETKATLFAFLRQAIPLPDYFGDNWDSLEECLADLSWLPDSKIALVHQDIPLEAFPSDQRIYLQILTSVARESNRLRIIFPEKSRHQIERIISTKDSQ